MNNIEKTIEFVKDLFDNSEYLNDKQDQKQYRLEHTFRVANIGKTIAEKEGLDVEAVIIGCLLHDISYVLKWNSKEEHIGHGRTAAKMAREFVMSLDMEEHLKHELLYGVAIHVDDEADFEGNRTVLAETIGEADNIDRFDRYRLYEHLLYSKMDMMPLLDKIEFVEKRVHGLEVLKDYKFKSETSNKMWNDNLDYQIEYYKGLLRQFQYSDSVSL